MQKNKHISLPVLKVIKLRRFSLKKNGSEKNNLPERKSGNDKFHVSHLDRLRSLDGFPLAGFRTRSMAFGIDLMVIAIMLFPAILKVAGAATETDLQTGFHLSFESLDDLFGAAITLTYFSLLTFMFNGQTIGKRMMKIRVISLKSEKLTLWQSFERSLGYGASALEAGFGFFQAIFYANKQAVHDRIAETAVIKVRK